jgi:5S rRNA maturation endonuclease (ribonuclease M5)
MNNSIVQEKDTLVEILEQAGAIFSGNNCTCPFHVDSNPSASIFEKEDHWRFRCFVCDLTLDYYDIIAKRENMDIAETLRMDDIEERNEHVYAIYEDALGDFVTKYEYYDKENHYLVTKVRLLNQETHKKTYRMITPYYGGFIRKGPLPPWPLYNQPGINLGGKSGVVVVEGEKCADALRELNIPATTALSSTSVDQTEWSPIYGKKVVIWPDPDKTGMAYARAIERKLTPHCPSVTTVDVVALGLTGKEDVVDYIEQGHGSDAIRAILRDAAKHTPADGVERYIEGMIDGSIRAIEWPWPMLHSFSQALQPGTITLIVGSPGCSKSLMLMEALAYWIDNDVQVALHVLEENKTFHLLRALAQRANMPRLAESDWVHANPEVARQAMAQHKAYLDKIGQHLYAQPDKQVNLSEVLSWMTEQFDAGCRIVVVDPITAASRSKDVWKADEEFVLKAKKLVDQYKASVIFVTHPVKQDCQPYLGNIRGGAAWAQFAQNIFWLEKTQGIKDASLISGQMIRMNRLLYILKARNAREMTTGKLAYLMTKGLKFHECGEFGQYEE